MTLSVSLVIFCKVSCRAVPKILELFSWFPGVSALIERNSIPHFTTVIRWILRVGYYLLLKQGRILLSMAYGWICIVDHTIQAGAKKAMVVLRILPEKLKQGRALTLQDADVLLLQVRESWTGLFIGKELEKLFLIHGPPAQIVSDREGGLSNGIRDALEKFNMGKTKVTWDITHHIASLLKRIFKGNLDFSSLLTKISLCRSKIYQSGISFLKSPPVREKVRFQNFPDIASWLHRTLYILNWIEKKKEQEKAELSNEKETMTLSMESGRVVKVVEKEEELEEPDLELTLKEMELIEKHFSWMREEKENIKTFIFDLRILTEVQRVVKNRQFTAKSYKEVCKLLSRLKNSDIKQELSRAFWEGRHYSKKENMPVLLTSDLIETLFGTQKILTGNQGSTEINRIYLALPCLCQPITVKLVMETDRAIGWNETQQWIDENIGETQLAKRRKVFGQIPPPNIDSREEEKEKEDSIACNQKDNYIKDDLGRKLCN